MLVLLLFYQIRVNSKVFGIVLTFRRLYSLATLTSSNQKDACSNRKLLRKGFPNLGQKGFNRRKPLLRVRGSGKETMDSILG